MLLNKNDKLRPSPKKRGSNQSSIRGYNEKLILQIIREQGQLSKAEATAATGLSANAISVIFRELEKENILLRGEPMRGKIGQPSTPLRINPKFKYYLTLRIARRVIELAIVDFSGEIITTQKSIQAFPTPEIVISFVNTNIKNLLNAAELSFSEIDCMGVAMPFELWHWTDEFSAPPKAMDQWRTFDLKRALGEEIKLPIIIENDATAACRAELLLGNHYDKEDWIYFYVDTFIGGGVVLNGSVFPGRRGNAGGFGPMRVPSQTDGNRLVDHASLVILEKQLSVIDKDPLTLYAHGGVWEQFESELSNWISRAGYNLSHAIVSSLAIMDFEAVVIDGMMPPKVRSALVNEVIRCLKNTDLQGVIMPAVLPGKLGSNAQSIGAAATIISRQYLVDYNSPGSM